MRLPPKSTSERSRVSTIRRPSDISRARMNSMLGPMPFAGIGVPVHATARRSGAACRAVGVHGCRGAAVALGRAIPTREQDAAVLQDLAVKIARRVEADLADAGAVGVHPCMTNADSPRASFAASKLGLPSSSRMAFA